MSTPGCPARHQTRHLPQPERGHTDDFAAPPAPTMNEPSGGSGNLEPLAPFAAVWAGVIRISRPAVAAGAHLRRAWELSRRSPAWLWVLVVSSLFVLEVWHEY